MTNARLLLLLVLGAVGTAAYLLSSGPEERIAKLVRDGRVGRAIILAEGVLAQGRATPRMLTTLAGLYDADGDPERAADLLEIHALAWPGEPDILAWLAALYGRSGNAQDHAGALERLAAIRPTRETLGRLAALHRLAGRFDAEFTVLDRAGEVDLLGADDRERLAQLLVERGRPERAAGILLQAEERPGGLGERGRMLLFEILLQTGATTEAGRLAAAWLGEWRKPWLADTLLQRLAPLAPAETTLTLARTAVRLFPETRFYLAKRLAEQGHGGLAHDLVRGWPAPDADLTEREIGGYVAVAHASGDPGLLRPAIAALRQAGFEQQAILAEAIEQAYGLPALAAFWPDLPPEALLRRPLLGVRLARLERRDDLVLWLARSADLGALRPGERAAWLAVLRATCGPFATFDILDRHRRRGELPAGFGGPYRQLAAQVGAPERSRQERVSIGDGDSHVR
jgi:tetratricopeptide (TPR) repeat protein